MPRLPSDSPLRRHQRHQSSHCPNCNLPLTIPHQHPRNYPTLERPPYKWKGHSLAPFDRSAYLNLPKEREGIFYTNHHLTEYRWLIKYHKAQIKDIERVHKKELRLLARRRSIVLKRCHRSDRPARIKDFETNFDILRFQQLWEKSLVYCRLRIELHHLRSNCKRTLLNKRQLTGPEKEVWNEAFLSEVRREQWETLLKIRSAFSREGLPFPEYLRAPFGQSLTSYFGKFGVKFGWYQAGDLEGALDGSGTPIRVWQRGVTFPDSFDDSEDLTPEGTTVCAKAKLVMTHDLTAEGCS